MTKYKVYYMTLTDRGNVVCDSLTEARDFLVNTQAYLVAYTIKSISGFDEVQTVNNLVDEALLEL